MAILANQPETNQYPPGMEFISSAPSNPAGSQTLQPGTTSSTLNYDPSQPVYVAPPTAHQDVALNADPAKATVRGQMTGILSSGSDYMKLNEAKGLAMANRRGLINSSIAIETARKAAIDADAVLPMASQDAKLYGNAATNNQISSLDYEKSVNNAFLTGSLTGQDYAGKYEMQKISNNAQLQRLNIDNQWKREINFDQLDVAKQRSLVGMQQQIGAQLTGGIERIMRDPNISDKTSAISALMANYKSQISTAAAVLGLDLTWN